MTSARATSSNVTVSFGLISFPVDLVAATKSKQAKAKSASTAMICPTCEHDKTLLTEGKNLVPLHQAFVCETHGSFAKGDAGTALVVDGEMRPVSVEAVVEAKKADGVRDVIELTVHPADEVEAHTFPSGNIYRLRPKGNEAHYGLVLELARNASVAFICEVTNKGATMLYRLVERDGVLVLTELVRPDRITEAEPMPDVSFDTKLLATGQSLVEVLCEPFDPAAWADRRKARLEALADQVRTQAPAPARDSSAVDAASDLLDLLRRSVDAAAA